MNLIISTFLVVLTINLKVQARSTCDERILVAATGDIMLHHVPHMEAHKSNEKFFSIWKPLAPYISAADVAYGNLESPVAVGIDQNGRDHGDIGFKYDLKVYSGTNKIFNYHPQALTDLRKVGFDVLSTANNHTMDRKFIGVDRTLDELIRGKWIFTGTRYSDGRGEWGAVSRVKGKNLYWLSCAENLNGNDDPYRQVLKCFEDQKEIEALVQKAVRKYDAVILLPHWGVEFSEKENQVQRNWAARMAELNVTAIIGNHPHVLQPLKRIQQTLVAYSLGNFSAWQAGVAKKTSVILYMDLRESDSGKLKVYDVHALPIFRQGVVMYPYYEKISSEALSYVKRHMGQDTIVSGLEFKSRVLSCEN